MKVLVISSVVPNASGFGGPLILHRYLDEDVDLIVSVFQWEQFPWRLKIIGKLRQLGLKRVSGLLECYFPVIPKAHEIDRAIKDSEPDVILTVAHGWLHIAAVEASERHHVGLVTFFQDWWSDFDDVPQCCRSRVDHLLRQTANRSSAVIGVSVGMLRELGSPSNAQLIHDLPSVIKTKASAKNQKQGKQPLRLIYFGNLSEYGPMIESVLNGCEGRSDIELHVYGPKPHWREGVEEHYRQKQRYHGSLAPTELVKQIGEYDGILVTMSFHTSLKRRMSTSFPSKLIEGVQFGLPIVVWGPDYCSAIEWGSQKNRALCITDHRAEILIESIATHQNTKGYVDLSQYTKGCRESAKNEFNPEMIRKKFKAVLLEAGSSKQGTQNQF